MESFLTRYRNITVLLLVIFAQLVLLAYQVKNDRDVRMIRVWAVTGVTPLARTLESVRSGTLNVWTSYFYFRDIREENRRMQTEVARLKLENQQLKSELATADRAKALAAFQEHTPSKTLAARVIGAGAGSSSKVLFLDRGSNAGVEKGMAVVTPDGIVGKIIASYPTASQMLLVTDPEFAAGVISQKNQVRGTLKGQGYDACRVDYIQNEEKVDVGEWFYTSGEDRIFPKGFPAGRVKVSRPGSNLKEVLVDPSGLQKGLEEVLILLAPVHQAIPEPQTASNQVYLAPPPPDSAAPAASSAQQGPAVNTDADRLHEQYKVIGEMQGHKFGEGPPGSKPPDFNLKAPASTPAPATSPGGAVPRPATQGAAQSAQPGTAAPKNSPPRAPAGTVKPETPAPRSVKPAGGSTAVPRPAAPKPVPTRPPAGSDAQKGANAKQPPSTTSPSQAAAKQNAEKPRRPAIDDPLQ
jgi:rod shape-determining protein MreC